MNIAEFVEDYGIAQDFDSEDAVKMIEAYEKSKWISVKDNIPKDDMVLVLKVSIHTGAREYGIMHISEYTPKSIFEGYCELGQVNFMKVTHWQSFPKMQ